MFQERSLVMFDLVFIKKKCPTQRKTLLGLNQAVLTAIKVILKVAFQLQKT